MFEFAGQEFAREAFEKIYKNNKISHAYILTGPDGVGKSDFAMYMAAKLLCSSKEKPCGLCSQCIKIKKGNHPDFVVIASKGKSIGVDEIRNLTDEIYTKPYEGSKKIVVIKEADTITVQGQNAILKTLEDPPQYATIIMLSNNENGILQTIRSRCQIFRLGRINSEKIKNLLINEGVNIENAELAASISDGILGNARKVLDKSFLELRSKTMEFSKRIIREKTIEVFKDVKFLVDNKDKIELILDIMMSWYRDITLIKLVKDRELIINKDFYSELVEESRILSYNRLDRIILAINDAKNKLKQYANFQLTMEVMLLEIQEV